MIPKLTLPTYEVTLPSNGNKVNIRPFLVKEEKLLLMAIESNDNEEIIRTTMQIIQNCIQDDLDISKLPFFDIDYLFIALRAKSVGESIEVKFHCNHNINNEVCGNDFKANIDISNCSIRKDESIGTDIDLGQKLTVRMRYPSYAEMKHIDSIHSDHDMTYKIIATCMNMIIQEDAVHTRKDFSAEIDDFLGNLTKEQYLKLVKFADNLPTFYVNAEAKCNKCKFNHKIEYNEFESFFV